MFGKPRSMAPTLVHTGNDIALWIRKRVATIETSLLVLHERGVSKVGHLMLRVSPRVDDQIVVPLVTGISNDAGECGAGISRVGKCMVRLRVVC